MQYVLVKLKERHQVVGGDHNLSFTNEVIEVEEGNHSESMAVPYDFSPNEWRVKLAHRNEKLKSCSRIKHFPALNNDIEPVYIDMSFEAYPNNNFRKELLAMPTGFTLPKQTVDKLIRAVDALQINNADFKGLRRNLLKRMGRPYTDNPPSVYLTEKQ